MLLQIDKNGSRLWFNDDRQFHRTDGPAVELANGSKRWYLNGKQYTEEEHRREFQNESVSKRSV